jgi:hypothetical protein
MKNKIIKAFLTIFSTLSIGFGGMMLILASFSIRSFSISSLESFALISGPIALLIGFTFLLQVTEPKDRTYAASIMLIPFLSLPLFFGALFIACEIGGWLGVPGAGTGVLALLSLPSIIIFDLWLIRLLKIRALKKTKECEPGI